MKRLLFALLLCLPVFAQSRPNTYVFLETHHAPYVKNFGQVERGVLYRGAQPDGIGLYDLKELGIKTVLDLRGDRTVEREGLEVESLGMNFVSFPLNGLKAPTDLQVKQLMFLLETLPRPIFIHCQHGEDRTGTIVACWRMNHNWSSMMAMAEAKFYHINWIQFAMKRYINNYQPKLLEFDEPVRH